MKNDARPWAIALMVWIALACIVIVLLGTSAKAHADPWCGPGSYYDFNHSICQGFRSPPPSNNQVPPNYYYDQGDDQ